MKQSLWKSVIIKAFISAGLFLAALRLDWSTDNPVLIGWGYSLAATLIILIFASLIFRLAPKTAQEGLRIMLGFALVPFSVFLLSLTGIFDGPYGRVCGLPMLFSSLVLGTAAFIGLFGVYWEAIYIAYLESPYPYETFKN